MLPNNIELKIVYRRRRTMALVVKATGEVELRAPLRTRRWIIDRFIAEHQDWLEKTIVKNNQLGLHRRHSYSTGDRFYYLGQVYNLEIDESAKATITSDSERLIVNHENTDLVRKTIMKWYRRKATEYLSQKLSNWAEVMALTYKDIKITSANSRWGSCTGKDDICFSWRLIMMPESVIDYVVIHELAHLRHRHHQSSFWAEVEHYCPNYKNERKKLKAMSAITGI